MIRFIILLIVFGSTCQAEQLICKTQSRADGWLYDIILIDFDNRIGKFGYENEWKHESKILEI